MKKFFFSLFLAFAIFFVNVDNAEAQCPDNWGTNFAVDSIIINYNGCDIKIVFCTTYSGNIIDYIVYKSITWNNCDGTFFNSESFWLLVEDQILEKYFNEIGMWVQPCSFSHLNKTYFNYGKAYCWKLVIQPTGLPSPFDKLMSYVNCDTPYSNDNKKFKGCLKRYTLCLDMTQNPPLLVKTYDTFQIDAPNCNLVGMPNYTQQQLNMLPVPYESPCYFSSCEFVPE